MGSKKISGEVWQGSQETSSNFLCKHQLVASIPDSLGLIDLEMAILVLLDTVDLTGVQVREYGPMLMPSEPLYYRFPCLLSTSPSPVDQDLTFSASPLSTVLSVKSSL